MPPPLSYSPSVFWIVGRLTLSCHFPSAEPWEKYMDSPYRLITSKENNSLWRGGQILILVIVHRHSPESIAVMWLRHFPSEAHTAQPLALPPGARSFPLGLKDTPSSSFLVLRQQQMLSFYLSHPLNLGFFSRHFSIFPPFPSWNIFLFASIIFSSHSL